MSASTHLNTGDRLAVAQLDDMATQVSVDEPWNSEHSEEWDRQTLDSRLRSHTSGNPECMAVTSAATEAILGCEPRELSLLYTVYCVSENGPVNDTVDTTPEAGAPGS